MVPPSQANSRPRQANGRAVQTLMAVRVTTGGWKYARSPETPAAVRVDECKARADVREGHASGDGACWGVPALAACRCACLHSARCQPALLALTQALHMQGLLGIQLKHGARPLNPSCCYAWVRLGCGTPPPEEAVRVWASGSTPAGHSLKSRLLFCWPPGT